MRRRDFDAPETYRGGGINEPEGRPRLRYPCFAEQCPMPGTLFTAGTDKAGVCAWHYGVVDSNIPRVTAVLRDWVCVSDEVNAARRVLSDPATAADPKAIGDAYDAAWARLLPCVSGSDWEAKLRPGNVMWTRGRTEPEDSGMREGYGEWARRLEAFVGARVVEALGVRAMRARPASRAHAFAEPHQPKPAGELAQGALA